jgi:signal transduction histidine kinase
MGATDTRRVAVRASAVGPTVRIDVEDTGAGIPAEMQDAVFEPFVRGAHDDEGGIGLGLATVKRLVEAHGGEITVQSTIGSGTLFRVNLPRASAT